MSTPIHFSLRRATPADAGMLSLVGSATFLDAFIHDIPGPALVSHCQTQHSVEVYASYLAADDPRTACWIAEQAETGAPIGYAVTCPPDLPGNTGSRDVEVKRIYCLSRAHGMGAGRALMDAAMTHARGLGALRLWLGTYEENARAVAFYKKVGFETVGTRQFQVGDQLFDDIVMAKML